jgi:hypothetical protein
MTFTNSAFVQLASTMESTNRYARIGFRMGVLGRSVYDRRTAESRHRFVDYAKVGKGEASAPLACTAAGHQLAEAMTSCSSPTKHAVVSGFSSR